MPELNQRIAGVLLGTAVGDALGLPREGLSARRAERLFGGPPLSHRFLWGRGMISDDTEHAGMVAGALLDAPDDADRFARSLARRLRWWLLGVPAGIGWATLRATLKLWLGCSPSRSGVFSAGNGPAMRSALLGACLPPERLVDHVRACTRVTHTDPKAEWGAMLVALAAAPGSDTLDTFLPAARRALPQPEVQAILDNLADHLSRGTEPAAHAESIGCKGGVSGYMLHTVPVALYCRFRFPHDFRAAIEAAILLGGDADTVGAVTGAIAGAALGDSAIPTDWLAGLCDWPRSVGWLRSLADALADRFAVPPAAEPRRPRRLCVPAIPLRNALFAGVVVLHALRRLLRVHDR